MKKLTYFLLLTVFSLSIAACSNKQMKVVTREDGGASVSNYTTYAWVSELENIPNSFALIGSNETLIFNIHLISVKKNKA